jgi:hypothetical protein
VQIPPAVPAERSKMSTGELEKRMRARSDDPGVKPSETGSDPAKMRTQELDPIQGEIKKLEGAFSLLKQDGSDSKCNKSERSRLP